MTIYSLDVLLFLFGTSLLFHVTVPLTGFGNLLAKGVREAIDKDGFLGIFTGGLKSAAGGITAAVFAGLLASLIFKPRDKA